MKQLLSPKHLAQAIGVSESSIKRWCDRGMIATVRTAGGHRRLRINSVAQFLRGGSHELIHPKVFGLEPAVSNGGWTLPEARIRFRDALIDGSDAMAQSVLPRLYLANHPVSLIADEVIAPAFQDIGELWNCGDVAIYEERRSCEICLSSLHNLAMCLPSPAASASFAIGATLDGDPYSIAVTLAELVLRDNGWDATCLGSSLSAETLSTAIRDCRPQLMWVSVSHIPDEERLVDSVKQLFRVASQHGTALSIGGRALTHDIRRRLSYSTFCDTFHHLEQFASTISRSVDEHSSSS